MIQLDQVGFSPDRAACPPTSCQKRSPPMLSRKVRPPPDRRPFRAKPVPTLAGFWAMSSIVAHTAYLALAHLLRVSGVIARLPNDAPAASPRGGTEASASVPPAWIPRPPAPTRARPRREHALWIVGAVAGSGRLEFDPALDHDAFQLGHAETSICSICGVGSGTASPWIRIPSM